MDKGFITLYRKMTEWEWYDDLPTFRLFICLLFLVNWEDKKWHGEIIKRGQIITSQPHLAQESGLSVKQVRRALENLKSTGEIIVEITNKFSKITIKNYSKYQDKGRQKTSHKADNKGNAEETGNEQGRQRADRGQTEGRQRATTKQLKPLKPLNNNNILEQEFEEIWQLYPRKVGKSPALQKYIKARQEGVEYKTIKDGVERYAEFVKGKDEKYIRHGKTWFNQKGWDDEYNIKRKTKQEIKDEEELF